MPDTPTFSRYAEIPVERMSAEQQAGYRSLSDGPRGRLPGPYRVWVHNPQLVHALAPLGNHFTPGQSPLSEREREITVLVICSKWGSAYPTNKKCGIDSTPGRNSQPSPPQHKSQDGRPSCPFWPGDHVDLQ